MRVEIISADKNCPAVTYMPIVAAMFALLLFFGVVSANAQSSPRNEPPRPVSGLDLKRYSGKWYEIAKYPNRFQRQCIANTTAEYTLKNNGRIEVLNSCTKRDGVSDSAKAEGKIADKKNNAKLKVRFAPGFTSWLPFVWANYWVVDLAEDYSYAVVSEPGRDYFWVLSRTPTMDEPTFQAIVNRAQAMGFDANRIVRTPQNATVRDGRVVSTE
ncbi:MAG: lipocalin family protein [Acidobacteriota bacterium]|nr:MAG: lipocalin family protein [Acidobacteriota bacterium]